MKNLNSFLLCFSLIALFANNTFAQNPFIRDQFTADPSARVFNGRVKVSSQTGGTLQIRIDRKEFITFSFR